VPALLVLAYLAAIVVANLISAHFGAGASIYNAFFLIGLSLTVRDRLDDLWGRHRFRNMALLIVAGSAISYAASVLLAPGAIPSDVVARIALASAVAFLVSESLDFVERSNISNLVGASLDSAIFVSIAFGWSWPVIFGQVCAKVAGGFVWSILLQRRRDRVEAAA
jgi:uncharacterized PurR-regulated membrane protein YhhQ (DUF165 family)